MIDLSTVGANCGCIVALVLADLNHGLHFSPASRFLQNYYSMSVAMVKNIVELYIIILWVQGIITRVIATVVQIQPHKKKR